MLVYCITLDFVSFVFHPASDISIGINLKMNKNISTKQWTNIFYIRMNMFAGDLFRTYIWHVPMCLWFASFIVRAKFKVWIKEWYIAVIIPAAFSYCFKSRSALAIAIITNTYAKIVLALKVWSTETKNWNWSKEIIM